MRPRLNGRAVFASTVPVTILKFHLNTVRVLGTRGYGDVRLVSSPGPDLDEAAVRSGAQGHALPMSRSLSPSADAVALVRWIALLAAFRPGLVIAGTPKCALLALVAARLTRVPRRVYMCGGLRLEGESGWRRRLLASMERLAMAAATEVVVNSRSLHDEVVAARLVTPSKLRQTLPGSSHGVDSAHFAPAEGRVELASALGLDGTVPVLGFVGRLTRDKGVETLVDAATRLHERGIPFRLLVVGPQDEPDSREWAHRLEASGVPLVMAGPVADPVDHYRLMSLLLLPSRREGFPNVVLEAAASGVPTVTTDATGCRDAVVDGVTGRIVAVDDAPALADAVEALLADPVLRAGMAAKARATAVEQFSPDAIAAQIVDPPVPDGVPGAEASSWPPPSRSTVLHVLPSLDAGGAERLVVEMTTAARARGVDARIAVLAPARPDSPVLKDAAVRGLPVHVLGVHRFDPRALLRLRRVATGSEVVHAHLFPAFYAVALVCRGRTVVTEHSPTNSRRGKQPFVALERLVYRRFDVKAAISEGVAGALEEYLDGLGVPGPVVVVRNGIALDRFAPAPVEVDADSARPAPTPDASLRLVTVGTLDARKNVGAAIEGVARVEHVTLTVVGDGPERSRLEEAAAMLSGRVSFAGLRDDVPELLREHDALLMTSRYEGFGLVAAEAMASGLPVLAPRLAGLDEVVGDAGLLHEPDDLDALADHIARLRDDPDLRARLARRARLRSARFDLDQTVDAYLDLYALPSGPR